MGHPPKWPHLPLSPAKAACSPPPPPSSRRLLVLSLLPLPVLWIELWPAVKEVGHGLRGARQPSPIGHPVAQCTVPGFGGPASSSCVLSLAGKVMWQGQEGIAHLLSSGVPGTWRQGRGEGTVSLFTLLAWDPHPPWQVTGVFFFYQTQGKLLLLCTCPWQAQCWDEAPGWRGDKGD